MAQSRIAPVPALAEIAGRLVRARLEGAVLAAVEAEFIVRLAADAPPGARGVFDGIGEIHCVAETGRC